MRVYFTVSFEKPQGATDREMRGYVEDAVSSMKGMLMPYGANTENPNEGDPMFYLDADTVKVMRIK